MKSAGLERASNTLASHGGVHRAQVWELWTGRSSRRDDEFAAVQHRRIAKPSPPTHTHTHTRTHTQPTSVDRSARSLVPIKWMLRD